MMLIREETRKVEVQLEVNLATSIKIKKKTLFQIH